MPVAWFDVARDLQVALEELGREYERSEAAWEGSRAAGDVGKSPAASRYWGIARAFFLIAGYAAENLIKGLWIAYHQREGRDPEPEAVLPKRLDGHQLARMAREAQLGLHELDIRQLDRLESAIVWRAKYPVSKDPQQSLGFGILHGEAAAVTSLLDRLEEMARAAAVDARATWPPSPGW
jgi:hypothetical protein